MRAVLGGHLRPRWTETGDELVLGCHPFEDPGRTTSFAEERFGQTSGGVWRSGGTRRRPRVLVRRSELWAQRTTEGNTGAWSSWKPSGRGEQNETQSWTLTRDRPFDRNSPYQPRRNQDPVRTPDTLLEKTPVETGPPSSTVPEGRDGPRNDPVPQ